MLEDEGGCQPLRGGSVSSAPDTGGQAHAPASALPLTVWSTSVSPVPWRDSFPAPELSRLVAVRSPKARSPRLAVTATLPAATRVLHPRRHVHSLTSSRGEGDTAQQMFYLFYLQ